MPITEKQRIQRRKHIGSSDMAAVMGLDPYQSAADVWLDKRGLLEPLPENDAMTAGARFEDGVLQYAEQELGPIKKNQYRVADKLPLAANIDAIVVDNGHPIEAKTSGLFSPLPSGWGEAMTNEVPDTVYIQTHVHMICTQQPLCQVPAFLGGRGFVRYVVERDQEIVDMICEHAVEFWRMVEGGVEPPDVTPSLEVLKRVKRQPQSVIEVDAAEVQAWLLAKEKQKEATDVLAGAQAAMLAQLKQAEAGTCGDLGAITYFEQARKGDIDIAELISEHKELESTIEDYRKPDTKYRVLRHRKKGLES